MFFSTEDNSPPAGSKQLRHIEGQDSSEAQSKEEVNEVKEGARVQKGFGGVVMQVWAWTWTRGSTTSCTRTATRRTRS
jgi:hypothetical protein